jgi:hypothetical protein
MAAFCDSFIERAPLENSDWGPGAADIMGFKGSEFRVQGSRFKWF